MAKLRLDDIDWEHDQLRIPRAKRREARVYPLLRAPWSAIRGGLQSGARNKGRRGVEESRLCRDTTLKS